MSREGEKKKLSLYLNISVLVHSCFSFLKCEWLRGGTGRCEKDVEKIETAVRCVEDVSTAHRLWRGNTVTLQYNGVPLFLILAIQQILLLLITR